MKGAGIQEKIMWEDEQWNGYCHKLSSTFPWPVKNK
jgi:hypothetical protein